MDIKAIKSEGRAAFRANYWKCVVVALLLNLLAMGTATTAGNNIQSVDTSQAEQELTDAMNTFSVAEQRVVLVTIFSVLMVLSLVSFLLRIFLFNPLKVGGYLFFRKNVERAGVGIGVIAEGFGGYGHTFLTLLLRDVFIGLWSLLFLIPGIVKSYSYMLVPYLLKDNPELSAAETITRSRELMNGHKWEAFVLDLSFIGWFLLGCVTVGLVNILWTNPYHENAKARFYLELLNGYGGHSRSRGKVL